MAFAVMSLVKQFALPAAMFAVGLAAGQITGRAQATAGFAKGNTEVAVEAIETIRKATDDLREAGKISTLVIRDRGAELRAILQRAEQNETSDGRTCLDIADSIQLRDNYAKIFEVPVQSGLGVDPAQ